MKIVRCLLDQVIFIWCLNYCSVSNNIVVRAVGSIAWPPRSWLGQLTTLMDSYAWSPRGAKPPSPARGSHKRNITAWFILPKCSTFQVSAVKYKLWNQVFLRRVTTMAFPPLSGLLAFSSKRCHGNWWMGAWGASRHKYIEKRCLHPCDHDLLGGTELNLATSGRLFLFQFIVLV